MDQANMVEKENVTARKLKKSAGFFAAAGFVSFTL